MYKIAVIGDRDSIYGFATLGLETFPVTTKEEAQRTFHELAVTDYAIIYITEKLYKEIEETVEKQQGHKFPAIIQIPGVSGNTGNGMASVKKLVEQAVGSDIIFNDK